MAHAGFRNDRDVVGTASPDVGAIARLRRDAEIGFVFDPLNPGIFWGFAVEVGEFREKVERYFSACEAR